MFNVTRLAINMTTAGRKAVKNIAKEKIDIGAASNQFKDFYQKNVQDKEYSKNIFTRAMKWIGEFFNNYKKINNNLNSMLDKMKKNLEETFTKQDKKNSKKVFFENIKESITSFKQEMQEILKKNVQE